MVNDFIDMRKERNRRSRWSTGFTDAVRRDRARTKILRTSPFGLIEMTRQRIHARAIEAERCTRNAPAAPAVGRGEDAAESMAIDVVRTLIVIAQKPSIVRVTVSVATEVADYLNNRKRHELARLEDEGSMSVQVLSEEHAGPEHLVFQYWDADDREVKFP